MLNPQVILPTGDRWTIAGSGPHQVLHYTHPDAPAATVPITAEALGLLWMAVSGVAFVDVGECAP
jgi:hypothetical protein